MKSIFVAVPHYGALVPDALVSLTQASQRHRITLTTNGASLLAHNFNCLWCTALNQRKQRDLTHFAMHHADVAADPGWIDTMLAEMERVGADVISAVIPIKDGRGLTSTGLQDPETLHIRRLTMKEAFDLPATFDAAAAGSPQHHLMVNTGLWVCRFTEPWIEEAHFEIRDAIVKNCRGRFQANVLSEDWNFSGWCARRGLRVFATRLVAVAHHGQATFRNDSPWGEWLTDVGDPK